MAAVATVAASTLLSLVLAELVLRGWELLRPRVAREVLDYGDLWREGGLGEGGLLREGLSARIRDGYGGTARWRTDAAGFRRDDDVPRERTAGSLRILFLGDSFTAGYRVDQEETFTHLLERELEAAGRWSRVEVLASVIEEPPRGFLYLSTHGVRWRPDLVLLGVTLGNDLAQSFVSLDPRGELRLDTAGTAPTIGLNPAEDQDALVAELRTWTLPPRCFDPRRAAPPRGREPESRLRLVRLVRGRLAALGEHDAPQAVRSLWSAYRRPRLFDNNGLGFYLAFPPPEIRTAYDRLFSVLEAYRDLAAAHGARFALAPFPQRFQVQPRDWRATVAAYGLATECFDLAAPNRRLATFCRRTGIPCLDPTPPMRRRFEESGESLYLPRGDMHWNARGHRAFADAVRGEVVELAAGSTGAG